MRECNYCGDPDFEAELFQDLVDDDPVCRTAGCGFVIPVEDVDPEDIAFGFHVVDDLGFEVLP